MTLGIRIRDRFVKNNDYTPTTPPQPINWTTATDGYVVTLTPP